MRPEKTNEKRNMENLKERVLFPGLTPDIQEIEALAGELPKQLRVFFYQRGMPYLWVSFIGGTGTGKSTIFNQFKKRVGDNNKFKFFPERYVQNPPFPFGSSNKQIGFRSELHFLQQLIRRNQNIVNFDEKYNGRIIILDRTPLCVLVYSKSLNLREKDYNLILDT